MKKTINPADAWRLAQAVELARAQTKGVSPPLDRFGHIVPSPEAHEEIRKSYVVSDEAPPEDPRKA